MIDNILKKTGANLCLDCGKCTGICSVAKVNNQFSPRMLVEEALLGLKKEIIGEKHLWSCLTCGACSAYCPSKVKFSEFVRGIRFQCKEDKGISAHGGIFDTIEKLMCGNIIQNRLTSLSPSLKISKKGKLLYFVGCQPYFDVIFEEISVNTIQNIANNTIKILNMLGIEPVVLSNERCCGHDALWTGEYTIFEKLATLNLDLIKNAGVDKIVTTCPECCRTLKIDYNEYFGLDCEVVHISEFLNDVLSQLSISNLNLKVTYHDPCRLGYHLGIYQEPRNVLMSIPGIVLVEMENNRQNSVCCGTSCWTECDILSENIRMCRLKDAMNTNASTVVTACPKCQIHFKCTLSCKSEQKGLANLEIMDIVTLIARCIK
jgi:Fe-S oxidoreductase